jgi:hypothetical protein
MLPSNGWSSTWLTDYSSCGIFRALDCGPGRPSISRFSLPAMIGGKSHEKEVNSEDA